MCACLYVYTYIFEVISNKVFLYIHVHVCHNHISGRMCLYFLDITSNMEQFLMEEEERRTEKRRGIQLLKGASGELATIDILHCATVAHCKMYPPLSLSLSLSLRNTGSG